MTSFLLPWSVRTKRSHMLSRLTETLLLTEAALGERWVTHLSSQGRINPISTISGECTRQDGSRAGNGCFNHLADWRLHRSTRPSPHRPVTLRLVPSPVLPLCLALLSPRMYEPKMQNKLPGTRKAGEPLFCCPE